MKLHAIGNFGPSGVSNIWTGIRAGLEALPLDYLAFSDSSDPALNPYGTGLAADVVVAFGLNAYRRAFPKGPPGDIFSVFWNMDYRPWLDPKDFPCDLLVATDADFGRWLPLGTVVRDRRPDPLPAYKGLTVFFGSIGNSKVHGRRQDIIRALDDRMGVRFVLKNFQYYTADFRKNVDDVAPGAYAAAAVCFDCSRNDRRGYTSDRIFNVTGSGGLYFGNYFPGLFDLFAPGVEIAPTFRDEDSVADIVDTVVAWVEYGGSCSDGIRQAAFVRAQGEHTYTHRIRTLWSWIVDEMGTE